jgi:hypothetical protein
VAFLSRRPRTLGWAAHARRVGRGSSGTIACCCSSLGHTNRSVSGCVRVCVCVSFCVTFKENANCAHATFRHAPHSQLDGHASNSHSVSRSHTHSLRNAHTYVSSRGPSSRQRLRRNEGVRISPCAEATVCCCPCNTAIHNLTSHMHSHVHVRAQLTNILVVC